VHFPCQNAMPLPSVLLIFLSDQHPPTTHWLRCRRTRAGAVTRPGSPALLLPIRYVTTC
jgi:hypothetical protein